MAGKKKSGASKGSKVESNRAKGLDEQGNFAPGRKKTGGRTKGTPNRFTCLRNAFLDAFDSAGGKALLTKMLKGKDKEERRFALSLIAKMLPTVKTVKIGGDEDSPPVDVLSRLPDDQLQRIVEEALRKGEGQGSPGQGGHHCD